MSIYQKQLQTITNDLAQARVRLTEAKSLKNTENIPDVDFVILKNQFIQDVSVEINIFISELQSMKDD